MPGIPESIWSAAVLLLFVMDPLGNIPILLAVLKGVDKPRRWRIIARELCIALVVLFVFLYAGEALLTTLHLQQESVTIAGGIVLLIIGLRMIFPQKGGIMGEQNEGQEPFIVPIAIPMIAGPSALATLLILARKNPDQLLDMTWALLLAWSASAVLLLASPLLYRLLRTRGLIAIERLMGMLLVMMAVQMFLNGLQALPNL